jgi:YD repeat-containing protein
LTLTDGRGIRKEFVFDGSGRLTAKLLDSVPYATYRYDQAGRRVLVDYADFQTITEMDAGGNAIRYSVLPRRAWARGQAAEPLRTADVPARNAGAAREGDESAERPRMIVDAVGGRTLYEYDKAGRIRALTLANGTRVEYTYDEQGRATGAKEIWR